MSSYLEATFAGDLINHSDVHIWIGFSDKRTDLTQIFFANCIKWEDLPFHRKIIQELVKLGPKAKMEPIQDGREIVLDSKTMDKCSPKNCGMSGYIDSKVYGVISEKLNVCNI